MQLNSDAILTLCSHLCTDDAVRPLEPAEWNRLEQRIATVRLRPADLFHLTFDDILCTLRLDAAAAERVLRLIDRSGRLRSVLASYESMGIVAVSRADVAYPQKLKETLGNRCPPFFYCAGNLPLPDKRYVGYVGSRAVSQEDIDFTRATVRKTTAHGFGVVSGGAKGIDCAAETAALQYGCSVLEFLPDSMLKRMKLGATANAIRAGQLLLLSVANPDADFNVGFAMMRNRFIYAQSCATVVIRSDYNKGGTWSGAVDNLKHRWCKQLCRADSPGLGNKALIDRGAIPIDEFWDGDVDIMEIPFNVRPEQLSLFDE